MPPVTCDWNFYIASDDRSKLYLSSNDDPANKDLVASVNGWTHSKQWKKFGEAQKGTVSLVKGELYYLEAIHKEGGGGDNLAVGWECLEHDISMQVISAEFTTASFLPTASPTISPTIPQCADDASCAGAGGVTNPCEERLCNLETGFCGSPTPIQGCKNGARLDRWLGIGGSNVENLTTTLATATVQLCHPFESSRQLLSIPDRRPITLAHQVYMCRQKVVFI